MSHSGSISIAYGIYLRNYDGGWMIQEAEDDWEYVLPWMEGAQEEPGEDEEISQLCRFLLGKLPEPPSKEFLADKGSYELGKLLTEMTGLALESFGFENTRDMLASGPVATHYTWGPVTIDQETLKVSDEASERLAWAIEALGCTPTDKPGVKVMASYG